MQKLALIPAYQPEPVLLDLALALYQNNFQVIVVDDGSGADFAPLFQKVEASAILLHHPVNLGKGAALKTGLTYIHQNVKPPYVVTTVDADGQHRIRDVLSITDTAQKQADSFVLGSRKLNHSVPLRSKTGNTITRFVFRLATGSKVYDTQTGLRSFSWKLMPAMLDIKGNRYEYEMNVLMKCAKKEIPILEVPIETVYLNNNASSHFHTVKDSYRIYKEILKFSASSLISFCIDYALFCLLLLFTNITFANIFARICSGTINYTLNRKMVFESSVRLSGSILRYTALATWILLCNTVLVNAFSAIGIPVYIAKILTELILFLFSWLIQHTIIFRKECAAS